MKPALRLSLGRLAVLIAAMLFCPYGSLPAGAAGPTTLVLASAASPNQAAGQGMLHFADLVKEKTHGRVIIQPHLAGSLFDEVPSIQATINGTLDIGAAANSNMGGFTHAFFWMDLPMVVKSQAQLWKVLDGPIGQKMFADVAKEQQLTVLMALGNGGARELLTTKKAVHSLADVNGLKIRAPGTPVELATWRAWGAIPTPIPWAETYTALSQGTVDGEGLQYTWAEAAKHTENIKYATELNYGIPVMMVVMRSDKLNAIAPEDRKALLAAAKATELWERNVDNRLNAEAKSKIVARGIQIFVPTGPQLGEWETKAEQVRTSFATDVRPELLARIAATK